MTQNVPLCKYRFVFSEKGVTKVYFFDALKAACTSRRGCAISRNRFRLYFPSPAGRSDWATLSILGNFYGPIYTFNAVRRAQMYYLTDFHSFVPS